MKNSKIEEKIESKKKEILKKVEEYHELKKETKSSNQKKIPYAGRVYDEKEMQSLVSSALDFWLTAGKYTKKFEEKFAKYLDQKSCILTNSGSSANLLALKTLTSHKLKDKRIKKGSEVITTAVGFPTTVNPIVQCNLKPVFVDVDLKTYNVNTEDLEKAISPKTSAIMMAHTLGNPFNVEEVKRIVDENNLYLIEDCCDALGSEYNEELVGTFGDLSTFSFYPSHHITMGEGGAVVTDSKELERITKSYRDWGRDCWCEPGEDNACGRRFERQMGDLPYGYDHKYTYSHIGYNLKALDLQPAIGIEQLKKLPNFIKKRRKNFRRLKEGLKKHREDLILPKATENSNPSWFAFPITIRKESNINRRNLINFLENNGIMTRMIFAGNITKQPAYQNVEYRTIGDLEKTNQIMNNTFFIGVYPKINKEDVNYIIRKFNEYFKER